MTTSHLDGIFVDNCFLEKGRAFSIWSDLGSPPSRLSMGHASIEKP